jgi:membrane associated rhomboid family serine protease
VFIPIGDDQEHERAPWVNRVLLAANAAVFLLFCLPPTPRLIEDFALNPGALRPIQVLTHLFLHLELWHVAGNLIFLWTFGRLVEERLGSLGHAALYLFCGLGSAALHLLAEKNPAPAHGATGAVAGIINASLVF